MKVTLLGHTQLAQNFVETILESEVKNLFFSEDDIWNDEISDGQVVSLAAIRECYSYKTAIEVIKTESEKYLGDKGKEGKRLFDHIMKSKHVSTMEHLNFSFAVEGVSRALLAQLTRHRQLSFSVQSQRYTKKFNAEINKLKENEKKYKNNEKRHGLCKHTIGEELKIVDMYKSGMSTRDIYKDTGIFHTTVNGILNAYNVEKRKGNESVVNHDFFEKIDSHRKAQMLGFICADGSVGIYEKNKDKPYTCHQLSIEVNAIDGYYLENFLNDMNSRNSVSTSKRGTNSICVVSEKMVSDLMNLGVVQGKTLVLDLSIVIEKLGSEYLPSFMLGYFEGDGHIHRKDAPTKMLSIVTGSLVCAQQLKFIFEEYGKVERVKLVEREDGSYCVNMYAKESISKALCWMYKNIELDSVLERKMISATESYEDLLDLLKNKFEVIANDYDFVVPEKIYNNPKAIFEMLKFFEAFKKAYINSIIAGVPQEDSRSMLPNGIKTNLVTSGNLRAWLEFYNKRKKGNGAQAEIAEFAEQIKNAIVEVEPWTAEYFELT